MAGETNLYVADGTGKWVSPTQPSGAAQAAAQVHGAAYDVTGTTTTIAVATTPYKASNTTTAGPLASFSHASNKLTYTGADTLTFAVTVALTVGYSGGAGSKNLSFYLYKDGVAIPGALITRAMSAAADRSAVTFQCLVSLATNSYIEVYCSNDTDTQGVVIDKLYLTVIPPASALLSYAIRQALVDLKLIKGSA